MALLASSLAVGAAAQTTAKAELDYNGTLFSVLAAINACGYDQEVGNSHPVRQQVRAKLALAVQASPAARDAREQLCTFYRDHRASDPARDLAQYVSLALNLGPPPDFALRVQEADLPPDAAYVQGLVPYLQSFYQSEGLSEIFGSLRPQYEGFIERYREAVSKALFDTDVYLRMPISGYVGRRLIIYLEPLAAPSQSNARNYASDYYLVLSPPPAGELKLDEVRHTYLHYVLDPLALKRGQTMKRLLPLLSAVEDAPLQDSFKNDVALLMTESLIRAIEVRMDQPSQAEQEHRVNAAMEEGYILSRYFFGALEEFEKGPAGFRDAYPDMLYHLNVTQELQRAAEIRFSPQAAPGSAHASNREQLPLLDSAESRLAVGDVEAAQRLAQQALDEKNPEEGRALFILARVAVLQADVQGARVYFERTLEVATEPRLLAWSHIYLGRLFDLEENREAALRHYQAALAAGDSRADTQAAAQEGLRQPYTASAAKRPN